MSSTGYPCLICYKTEVDAKENKTCQENEAENKNNESENDLNNSNNSAAAVLTSTISPSTPSAFYPTQRNIVSDDCIFEAFCLSFGIQLPLHPANIEVEWNNRKEENNRKFPFCVSCRPVAQNLLELNKRFTSIKIEIEQAKLRIRSSILSSIKHDKKKLRRSQYRYSSHGQNNHSKIGRNNSDNSAVNGNKSEYDVIHFKNHFVGPKCKMKKKEMKEFQETQVRIIRDLIVGPTLRLSKCDNMLSGPTSSNTENKKSPLEFTYAPGTDSVINNDNTRLELTRSTGNKILDLTENTTTKRFDDTNNHATATVEMATAIPEDQVDVAHKNQDVVNKGYQVKVEAMEELIEENNDNDDDNDDIGIGSYDFDDLPDRAYDDGSSDDQDQEDDDSNDKDFALPSDSEEELVSFGFDTSSVSKKSKVNPSKLRPRRYPPKKSKIKSAGSAIISDKPKSLFRKTIKCDGIEDKYIYDGQYEFTGNPVQGFQCSLCPGRKFMNKSKVTCHIRDTHTPKRKRCPICGKCFRMTKLVNQHIRNTHDSDKCVVCEICGKSVNRSTLSTHKKTVHIGERRFICELCGKGFTSSQVLRRHMGSHSTSQPYECELCFTKFKKKGTLTRHLKTFHGYVARPTTTSGSASVSTSTYSKSKSVEDLEYSETVNEKKEKNPTPIPIPPMPKPVNLLGSEIEACVEEDAAEETGSSRMHLKCKLCGLQYNRQNNLTRHLKSIHHINVKGLAWKSRRSIDPNHHSSQPTFPGDSFSGLHPHPSSRPLPTINLFPQVSSGVENRNFLFPSFNPFSESKI